MANMYPENYENNVTTIDHINTTVKHTGYKSGILYDIQHGAIQRDGTHRILSASGIESWKQWCFNCLSTERYSCAAYSTDFGVEYQKAMQAETREEAELILTTEITEALMADPYKRTKYVEDITFNWLAADSVEVTVVIQGVNNVSIDVTAVVAA